jgi:hypothetical protein
MRRGKRKNARAALAWFAVAFLLGQGLLAVQLEWAWPEARDPEWHLLVQRLQQRRDEAPDRPLVVVLGSSRSQMAFDAAWLSRDPAGPVVFNAAVAGSGALAQRVYLERLLARGLRPDAVVVEVMPPYFSAYGARFEESYPLWQCLTLAELVDVAPRAQDPSRVVKVWLKARLLPVCYHQPALQRRLVPACLRPGGDPEPCSDRDSHGWKANHHDYTARRRAELERFMLNQYDLALRSPPAAIEPWARLALPGGAPLPDRQRGPVLSGRRVQRLDDLVSRCRQEGIGCALLVAPESSQFRARLAAPLRTSLDAVLADLARKHAVEVHDARAWLGDEDFMDGHHATRRGAVRFTARFEQVLKDEAISSRRPVRRDEREPTRPGRQGGSRPPGS